MIRHQDISTDRDTMFRCAQTKGAEYVMDFRPREQRAALVGIEGQKIERPTLGKNLFQSRWPAWIIKFVVGAQATILQKDDSLFNQIRCVATALCRRDSKTRPDRAGRLQPIRKKTTR